VPEGQGAPARAVRARPSEGAREREEDPSPAGGETLRRAALPVLLALFAGVAPAGVARASMGVVPGSFHAEALNRDGTPDTTAGSHPYEYTASFEMNHDGSGVPEGSARTLFVAVPPGFVGNPTATPLCRRQDFDAELANCPPATQIGTLSAQLVEPGGVQLGPSGALYNLVPPQGAAASFGFQGAGFNVIENATLIPGGAGSYRVQVTANVPKGHVLSGTQTIWGVPADPSHDAERECINSEFVHTKPCSIESAPVPFLRMPTNCETQPPAELDVQFVEAPAELFFESASQPAMVGCETLDFRPTITVQPETSAAATATGLHVDLHMPQEESPGGLAEADLKDAVVTLPQGMVVNPSAANGLAGCSSAQIGLGSTAPARCPAASKIGVVEVDTPLLDHPLPGAVYVATQGDNPFASLLAIYVVVEDPETGIVVKLAGHVEPDPSTGQLTTRFSENPQFPFEDFKLDFTGGERAPLITPDTCGAEQTTTAMRPWTAPEGHDANPSSTFLLDSGPRGGPCVSSAAQEPHAPGFEAGTAYPIAGHYSPFVLRLTREQGSQPIRSLEVTLPPGMTGSLAGIPRCPDDQIAAAGAAGRTGAQEQANPSCPVASEVGTVDVGAGAGGSPVHVTGHAYLAGPYEGAPFSLAIVTPAVAGPFDLGVVVVRSALYINPQTAQVTVRSDPIPAILDGIPLDVRSIAVNISRDHFTLNPTSCERMSLVGAAASALGAIAPLSDPFQVGGCAGLPFAPTFAIATQAHTSKVDGASLSVKVTQQEGEANIHKVLLQLPKELPSRLTTIQKACTEAQFASRPEGGACPEGSNIGRAKAVTPLLDAPLEGPGYLVSHGGAAFPDVVFLLKGEGVHIELVGHTDIKKGITYSRFETVPDAPIRSFEASLPEGPHSALGAFGDLCAKTPVAPTTIVGQNGAQVKRTTKIAVVGCPKPTLKVTRAKVTRQGVRLSVSTSRPGTIVIRGAAFLTLKRRVGAGRHSFTARLSSVGRHAHRLRRRARLKVGVETPAGAAFRTLMLTL